MGMKVKQLLLLKERHKSSCSRLIGEATQPGPFLVLGNELVQVRFSVAIYITETVHIFTKCR